MKTPRKLSHALAFALSATLSAHALAQIPQYQTGLPPSISGNQAPEGYSVGNFGIAAALNGSGLKIIKSLMNTPILGEQLEPFGTGELRLSVNGKSDFTLVKNYSVFPENHSDLISQSTGVRARIETFAPISDTRQGQTSFNTFLPAILVQAALTNVSARPQTVNLAYLLSPEKVSPANESETFRFNGIPIHEVHRARDKAQVWLMAIPDAQGSVTNPASAESPSSLAAAESITLAPHQSRRVTFAFGVYDSRSYTSAQLTSRRAFEQYLLTQGIAKLAAQHARFITALPRTGDAQLDTYLRWYLSAAVLLTKGISTGQVLTMGYAELNQRDSFWTSGAHLVYWPDLERKMLEESMANQDPNGQIPMTILPIIRRANNVDGNEYFILRIARYYEWRRDDAFLQEALPHVKRAIDYLISLDREHIGIPTQVSFWADWKDVAGVEGRTYAPHFDLLYLAALKQAETLANAAHDTPFASQLSSLYTKASERINRSVEQGGLWDNTRYVDLWKDNRRVPYTLEDQTVATIYGVIPQDRLNLIYKTLNQSNESRYGVRDTYPYITSSFKQEDYGPAQYHNGGIWPWLNFADAYGRFLNGHSADAERILKEVGKQDLVSTRDYIPNEFLNGETGKNEGEAPQGWDADFFSAIYFGAFGLTRTSAHQLNIHIHLPASNNFTTIIRLPEGDLQLTRSNGKITLKKYFKTPLEIKAGR